MLALSEYAERLGTGENAEVYLQEQLTRLPKEAAVALEFLAADARRDEDKYQETIERRTKCKEERKPRPAAPAPAGNDDIWKYIPD